jgi:filamentous hemagglutinin family protein
MAQKQRLQSDRAGWAELISVTLLSFYPIATPAQMLGDSTLGTQVNGSEIAPCTGVCIITNGATRGNNLFHSFRQFSLPNQDVAGFITTPAIQNVIVRVTGVGQPFISTINGTIATSNPANFFLLNPNGIIFGPRAFLDIGGTFLATTADRMRFADGTEFLTDAPTPLLTVSVPIGLQLSQTPKNIQMQGTFFSAGDKDRFRDFALIGGDVLLDNSFIAAPGQRIALAGAGENGAVGLQLNGDRLSLRLTASTPRRDITLTNDSFVTSQTSNGGGEVLVAGRNIVFRESTILAGIVPGIGNAATNQAGDITIDAASLQVTQGSAIGNLVLPNALGQGGNTNITASDIQLRDGSRVGASLIGTGSTGNVLVTAETITLDRSWILNGIETTGSGRSGDITVTAASLSLVNGAAVSGGTLGVGNGANMRVNVKTIAIDGISPDGRFVSGIGSEVGRTATGRGGDVTLTADLITMTNGGVVSASIFGNGNGGNVRVTAKTIALDGISPTGGSGITSQVFGTGSGNGGNIVVETGSLTLTNGAAVSAGTVGNGNAGSVLVTANTIVLDGTPSNGPESGIGSEVLPGGNGRGGDVTVNANAITITRGARISASTFGSGDGGNVHVTANTIALDGIAPTGEPGGIFSVVGPLGSGRGGDVTVQSGSLTLANRATVSSSALGDGSAGNLGITARTISLDRADITATAASGNGANITLNVRDLLLLRNNSQISTSAGTAQAGGDGGNITINTAFLIAVPREDSNIRANAFTGRGGNVEITAQGIFGIEFQPVETPFSDITASSQFGINGTVVLNTLDIDPTRGIVSLPAEPRSPELQEGCQVGGRGTSRFIRTGRGGLPTSPDERLNSMESLDDVALPDRWSAPTTASGKNPAGSQRPTSIVEAQNWLINDRGEILLVGEFPPCIQAEAVGGRTGE